MILRAVCPSVKRSSNSPSPKRRETACARSSRAVRVGRSPRPSGPTGRRRVWPSTRRARRGAPSRPHGRSSHMCDHRTRAIIESCERRPQGRRRPAVRYPARADSRRREPPPIINGTGRTISAESGRGARSRQQAVGAMTAVCSAIYPGGIGHPDHRAGHVLFGRLPIAACAGGLRPMRAGPRGQDGFILTTRCVRPCPNLR